MASERNCSKRHKLTAVLFNLKKLICTERLVCPTAPDITIAVLCWALAELGHRFGNGTIPQFFPRLPQRGWIDREARLFVRYRVNLGSLIVNSADKIKLLQII